METPWLEKPLLGGPWWGRGGCDGVSMGISKIMLTELQIFSPFLLSNSISIC